jgi:hypothetical protein
MKFSSLNFLLIGALLAWFTGYAFLLFGYMDELAEPNLYQPALCNIAAYNMSRSLDGITWSYNLLLNYKTCSEWLGFQSTQDPTGVNSRFNTKLGIGSPFPCLVTLSTISNSNQSSASIYLGMPENITPLTVAGVLLVLSFAATMIYLAANFYTYYKRRHYRALEGQDTEIVTMAASPPVLDDENIVVGTFGEAQKIFWANEKLYSSEDFGVLKKLQIDAIIDPKSRKIFQLTLASHLRRLSSSRQISNYQTATRIDPNNL